jgi:sorbose reductase
MVQEKRTPMSRMGEREEAVGPCVLMASSAGTFMMGTDIVVDGGYKLI